MNKVNKDISLAEYVYNKLNQICDVEANFSYFINVLFKDYNAYDIPYQIFLTRFGLSGEIFELVKFMGTFDNFEIISSFGREYVETRMIKTLQ